MTGVFIFDMDGTIIDSMPCQFAHVLTAIADYRELDPMQVLELARRHTPHPTETLA